MPFCTFLQQAALQKIFDVLDLGGEETRVVGGSVRNLLLGLPSNDIDLTTTLLPQQVMQLASRFGLRALPTGLDHGTVTVLIDDLALEITTLREDIETDGRHAVVRFGRDFEADAQRRDFTINALSLSRDGVVHDYVGGLEDLKARRVRFIGEAGQRLGEDYLRALRYFRFWGRFGQGAPDAQALSAIAQARWKLRELSPERVYGELQKIFALPDAVDVVAVMAHTGLFDPLIGGIVNSSGLARLLTLGQTDALLALSSAAIWVEEDILRLRERLRLANRDCRRLSDALEVSETLYGQYLPPDEGLIRSLLFRFGRSGVVDGLRLAAAHRGALPLSGWRSCIAFAKEVSIPALPLTGEDILRSGAKGPLVGQVLKVLQARWILAGFPHEPHVLKQLLQESLAEAKAAALVHK